MFQKKNAGLQNSLVTHKYAYTRQVDFMESKFISKT